MDAPQEQQPAEMNKTTTAKEVFAQVATAATITLGSIMTVAGKSLWTATFWVMMAIPLAFTFQKAKSLDDSYATLHVAGVTCLSCAVTMTICFIYLAAQGKGHPPVPMVATALAITGFGLLRGNHA